MKKLFQKIIVFCLLVAFCLPLAAVAQDSSSVTIENPFGSGSTLWTIIDKVINFAFKLSLYAATIMIIVAGYFFIFAKGDPEKILRAKRLILWTLIGLGIIIAAKGIVALAGEILGVETPYNQPSPPERNPRNII